MPTQTLPPRTPRPTDEEGGEKLSRGLVLALGLHALVAVGLLAAAWVAHDTHRWGDSSPQEGAIQASAVSAIPLPPKQRLVDKEVLADDKTSPAPTPPPPVPEPKVAPRPEKTAPPPRANEIPIPDKTVPPKNAKFADRPQPETTRHPPAMPPPPTPKATSGVSPGVQIPFAVTELKNGTASLSLDDRTFGDRYAYYIKLIGQRANQSKVEGGPDSSDARGKRAIIRFVIQRDGTPSDITVDTRSGSAELDTSTMRAIQRIETFGPLPAGDHLVVRYIWDSH
jgi:protein TonB